MLVPLMLSLDLEATSKTSESQPETRLKPQLHTQKNHSSYNGTRTLPIATRVRSQSKPKPDEARLKDRQTRKSKRRSTSSIPEDESPLYEVTLYYPHNRACTIFRSREDFSLLRTGLHSRSSSTAPQPLATPPSDNITGGEEDPKEVTEWDLLLRKAVEKFAKNGHGRYSVEWFLRRRLGDCERMASGKGTGLPAGTTRRITIKQPENVDGRNTRDESERQFTEVVFGLDSLPVEPFKPIPDPGKLAGSSLAKRRKNKQKVEAVGREDQKTVHRTEDFVQKNVEDGETSISYSTSEVETMESSSSEGTTVLTPTSSSVNEMSTGDLRPNSALMYMLMFSRRASDPDLEQKFFSLQELDNNGANTL